MSNLPKRFLTIPEVVAKYCPSLIAWKKNSHPNIKTDGALDEPMKNWSGGFVEINKMYVSTDSQRVKGIQANYLIDKLKEYGGFLHKKTIAEQIYCPKYDIDITVDAMHRAILAWLCDVKEIRRMIVDEHDINDNYIRILSKYLLVNTNDKQADKLLGALFSIQVLNLSKVFFHFKKYFFF